MTQKLTASDVIKLIQTGKNHPKDPRAFTDEELLSVYFQVRKSNELSRAESSLGYETCCEEELLRRMKGIREVAEK